MCTFSNQSRSNLLNDDKDEFHKLTLKLCSGVAKSEKCLNPSKGRSTVVPFNKTNIVKSGKNLGHKQFN